MVAGMAACPATPRDHVLLITIDDLNDWIPKEEVGKPDLVDDRIKK